MANVLTLPRFIEEMYEIVNNGYNNHEVSFDTEESLRQCVHIHRINKTFDQWYISKSWHSRWGSVLETFKHNWTEPPRISPTRMDYIKFWQVVNQFQYLAYNIEENHWESSKDDKIDDKIKIIKKRINDIKNEHDQNSTDAGNPFLIHI